MTAVDVEDKHVLLANIDGEVYAVSGYCTHEETDLVNGFMIEDRVVCPLHLSEFDLKSGAVQNPPATAPLVKFNVKIEDETVFIEV